MTQHDSEHRSDAAAHVIANESTPEAQATKERAKQTRLRNRRWRKRLLLVGGLTLPVLGAAWTVGQFLFQTVVIPASLPVTMSLTADLTPVTGQPKNKDVSSLTGLEANIHAANFGGRRVIVLAAWYQLWGYRLEPADSAKPERAATDEMKWCSEHLGGLYARENSGGGTLIETGRFFDSWSFDPGESTDVKRLLLLDATKYDFVRLVTEVTLAKGTALEYMPARSVSWPATALSSDSSAYCESDMTGSFDGTALYYASWRALNQSVLPFLHDDRWIGVEWRATNTRFHKKDSTEACSTKDASDCVDVVEIGKPEANSTVWPFIGVCDVGQDGLTACELLNTMSTQKMARVTQDFGIISTVSSVDMPIWGQAGGQGNSSPEPTH